MTYQNQPLTHADATMRQASCEVLMHLLSGMTVARCLYCAARFQLASLVNDGPKSLQELAQASRTHAPSLLRLLRALASIGVFEEVQSETFAQTTLSSWLLPGVPGSLYEVVLSWGADYQWNAWEALEVTLIAGTSAFEHVYSTDMHSYLSETRPDEQDIFQRAVTRMKEAVNEPLIATYDFSSFYYLVDIGGGPGSVLLPLLGRYLHLVGVIVEQPSIVGETQAAVVAFPTDGVPLHCDVVAGDYFEDVPVEADVYLLKHLLRNWSDEACLRLLRNCRQSMRPDGRVLVIERVLRPGRATPLTSLLDMHLLVLSAHGRERTEEEYRRLFEVAGLRLTRVLATASPVSILEGMLAPEVSGREGVWA